MTDLNAVRINTLSRTAEPTFISVDIETTGPSPTNGEICSIGAVPLLNNDSFDVDESNTFYVNLEFENSRLTRSDPDTMEWWKQWPDQWNEHRAFVVPPQPAILAFATWTLTISKKPIFVAWPVAFDWGFVNYYMWKYIGSNPFGYSPVCIKNFALGALNKPYALLGNREEAKMPATWLIEPEQIGLTSHVALDDAVAQAYMFQQILNDMANGSIVAPNSTESET